jgi:hypothetical protein
MRRLSMLRPTSLPHPATYQQLRISGVFGPAISSIMRFSREPASSAIRPSRCLTTLNITEAVQNSSTPAVSSGQNCETREPSNPFFALRNSASSFFYIRFSCPTLGRSCPDTTLYFFAMGSQSEKELASAFVNLEPVVAEDVFATEQIEKIR